MTPAAPSKPEFKYSVKDTNEQIPWPVENTDYYKEDKLDCTVAFEIHVPGFKYETDIDIKSRAYESIKADRDLECLGVMMKERDGSVCFDMDNKPFDREAWIKQKTDELKAIRKEKSLLEFVGV